MATTNRIWEIDTLRGIALLLMLSQHVVFDLKYFDFITTDPHAGIWGSIAYSSATVFLLLVGISLVLKYQQLRNRQLPQSQLTSTFIKRGFLIFGCGLVITTVTFITMPNTFIAFGILHCIGLSTLFGFPLVRYPRLSCIVGLGVFGLGIVIATVPTHSNVWLWLGLHKNNYASADYFPLLPWFSFVCFGISLGHVLYKDAQRTYYIQNLSNQKILRLLQSIGRRTLVIYMVHQPILFGIFYMLKAF